MFKRLALPAVLMLVAMAVAGILYVRKLSPVTVDVARVERDVEIRVFGLGSVEAQVLSRIGFQVAGRIVQLAADQGEIVPAGTVLATLEDSSQRARVAKAQVARLQAQAALARAQALLQRSEANLQQRVLVNQRRQSLVDRGSVSREQADEAQTNETLAQADLAVAKAEVRVAEAARDDVAAALTIEQVLLDQHRIMAPYRARILSRLKEAGAVAGVGEVVFTIIEPNSVWVRVFVDEAVSGGLAIGQKALVRLRSEMNTVVEAQIVRIDQENDRVTEERRVYVRCVTCEPEHEGRYLGEQAEIEIIKRVVPEGLFVPLRAVSGFDGRAGTIWTVEDGKLHRRLVALGDRLLDGRVLIVGGLPAGARAVVSVPADGFTVGRRAVASESSR
ncbi:MULTISPECIES: efflux RND transporter periplasmic adaptor subunit [unclassified Bosea (in: a-proteobacteria)]|uniref:efflux RND transporter periplasmic adaptor subunit n=1 Tax=unclassified Bosea (in: a-proteobacteria) TaxID=2653178 RepID=UPI0009571CA9|nr:MULTISPECIES: efflux RND transporter periplasmic adaptor subunit [unclassified Bosea (in: a-proteobacteria)]TAJ30732.1 MAG: efflux RND transporter periplasmic adaptor subunit [Bosea sp. (in: a-proteobacteria)]SIR26831.1 HlyD family secretion protein [Bosea sp. TND4EK4]